MNQQQLYTTSELAEMSAEDLRIAQANGFVKSGAAEPSQPSSPQDEYAVTSWGSDLYDFVVPSGQRCQMRKLKPETLIGTDLLDKVTRLPAFAEENIRVAEGKPPAAALPDKEALAQLVSVLNELLPMVVVQPKLWPDPKNDEERVDGRVYVSQIELADRVAIMERAVGGVAKMDNFREKP